MMGFWKRDADKPLKKPDPNDAEKSRVKDEIAKLQEEYERLLAKQRRDFLDGAVKKADHDRLEELKRNGIISQEYFGEHVTPEGYQYIDPQVSEEDREAMYAELLASLDALEQKPPPKVMKIDPKREARRGHAT